MRFRKIPGSSYSMNSNGEIIGNKNEKECELSHCGKFVTISLYDRTYTVDMYWLKLYTLNEVYLPEKFQNRIMDIQFIDSNPRYTKFKLPLVMVFKRPIEIKPGFRLIPGWTQYAIDKFGNIIKSDTLDLIYNIKDRKKNKNSYLETKLYNPISRKYENISIHKLVALAWISNNDFISDSIVNHKDGDKSNCYYENLEWCSVSHNNKHAYLTGLRSDNKPCKIRNYKTKEIKEFRSIADACEFMQVTQNSKMLNNRLLEGKLIANTWEIKSLDDDSPWFYENRDEKVPLGKFIVKVKMPGENEIREYRHSSIFQKELGLWNCPTVHDRVEKAKQLYPGIEIEVIDLIKSKPIQCLNTTNNEVFEFNSTKEASKALRIKKHIIYSAIQSKGSTIVKKYCFRYKSDSPWPENPREYIGKTWRIRSINRETGYEQIYESLRECARAFCVDRDVIKHRIRNKQLLKNHSLAIVN